MLPHIAVLDLFAVPSCLLGKAVANFCQPFTLSLNFAIA